MSSELRVRCFWDEPTPSLKASSSRTQSLANLVRGSQGWSTTGDRSQVLSSLAELVDCLDADSNDYVVKVFVHRRMPEPQVARPVATQRELGRATWNRDRASARGARAPQLASATPEREHGAEQRAQLGA